MASVELIQQQKRARQREYARRWKDANPEKARESARESTRRRRAADPEATRASARESMRLFRARHPDQNRENKKRWYEQNREKDIAKSVQWARDNPARAREKLRSWRVANAEKHAAQARQYSQARRARKIKAPGKHTFADVQARFAFHGTRCVYCGAAGDLHVDHMIPLARGGTNWPANLVPACGTCNGRKYTRTYFEFISERRAA